MRIVFMGTPDFAVPCLTALCDAGHDVVAAFTQPDKPVGRKQILTPPPVKEECIKRNIPVYQPTSMRDVDAELLIKELAPEVIIVVAYGKILPQSILDIPEYGCINVHASLLPRHRGASPIQWCIVCGDTETGVCTMQMDAGMDTGDILLCQKTEIGEKETAGELFDRLSDMGAELLIKTLKELKSIIPKKQGDDGVTYAPIIKKNMALLDFKNKTAKELSQMVRGYNPWPVAYFTLDSKRVQVYSATVCDSITAEPGRVYCENGVFAIGCADSKTLVLERIKPEGSREMSAEEFLRGKNIMEGTVIIG